MAAEAELLGTEYIGQCPSEFDPDSIGKLCHRLLDDRGAVREYMLGFDASDVFATLTIERDDRGWHITERELPPHLSP